MDPAALQRRLLHPGGAADDSDNLDRVIFGSKKKPIMPPANDRDQDYPDPMEDRKSVV